MSAFKIVTRSHPDVPAGTSYKFDTSPEHRFRLERLGITDVAADEEVYLFSPVDYPPPRNLPGQPAVIRSVGALHRFNGLIWRWDGECWEAQAVDPRATGEADETSTR